MPTPSRPKQKDAWTLPNLSTVTTSPSAAESRMILSRGGQRDQVAHVDSRSRAAQCCFCRQMRGNRHEDVAAVKRRGHLAEPQLAIGQAEGALRAACRRTAQESRPLSGPTNTEVPACTAMPRLAVPTPGSTTATWTARRQEGQGLGQHGGPAPDVHPAGSGASRR